MVDFPLYPVGVITDTLGIEWQRSGKPVKFKTQGFTHF
jgi:hypothetical protein